ncbi:MAG: hypothetical protein AAGG08_03885 [Actinomycetota bacterium]
MSVDTNTKGKNTAVYRKLRHQGMSVLVSPQLLGMAEWMRVTTKGVTGKKLAVEFRAGGAPGDGCNVC